ncbi:response regulator [Granulicatella sp. zg-ZJ]|uniref:response regulator transcription factor n=1 Tax=unclassified Granulicatella TaxID=2630493 RepID=UPI0013BFE57A|nr:MULTISPECIES: response regulator transcription factor [unclassified Granulicatella]MBS4749471.1 response regulator transcription factor [Carnobacteriaceae bacterium zg-ZUI78]NEW62201.1 response regulator [Granulicatella sp. zg-ZJ]NEW66975.1 response regulator [Granulicatella sp. zg-84]QMI85031.1 response regulator transcription factor [Carnobacteriaceae bacterium zg-84]
MKILVVEDEKRLADTIVQILKQEKHLVDVVYDGQDAYDYITSDTYDAVVLDMMLPKLNGIQVLKLLRQEHNATPILMLTAKDQVEDKVRGLDSGADDYLTKPFEKEELLARIRAISRRKGDIINDDISFVDITLSQKTQVLECGSKSVRLGPKEFDILRLLLINQNQIMPKEDLISRVWGFDSDAEDNNVEVYISFLRKKLQFLSSRVTISTARKVGYFLEEKE